MIKVRTLVGLAVIVFTMAASVAPAVGAPKLESEKALYPLKLTAKGTNPEFITGKLTTTCEEVEMTGEIPKAAEEFHLAPNYEPGAKKCLVALTKEELVPVKVKVGTCKYLLKGVEEKPAGTFVFALNLDPAGCKLQIEEPTLKCTITITGEQQFPKTITLHNVGAAPKEVELSSTVLTMKWTATAGCGIGAAGEGSIIGIVKIKGKVGAAAEGVVVK